MTLDELEELLELMLLDEELLELDEDEVLEEEEEEEEALLLDAEDWLELLVLLLDELLADG